MAKIYAVKQGRVPGIYLTWDACEKQVKGYKGAEYKSFKDVKEAEKYVFGETEVIEETSNNSEIYFDADEINEFKFLLKSIKKSGLYSLESIKDLVENIEDVIETL